MFEDHDKIGVDNEQKVKEDETLQLLVSAGYFRARIKGLDTFDKVIGGMTWCIQGCSMDIDIDLLFQENWNIGKKIALTEKIVRVLKKMKCPHNIEPHQIQGSDFEHIYPVVQWLVKQILGRQDERMEVMKQMSCKYFDRNSKFTNNEEIHEKKMNKWVTNDQSFEDCTSFLDYLNKCYWPQRKYRKPESMRNGEEEIAVVSTLLEYGKQQFLGKLSDKKSSQESKETSKEEENAVAINENIQGQMSTKVRETTKMAGKIISQIIDIKKEGMHEVVEDYQTKSNILMQTNNNTTAHKIEAVKEAIEELNGQLLQVNKQSEKVQKTWSKMNEDYNNLQVTNDEKKKQIVTLQEKISESIGIVPDNINIEEVEDMVKKLDELKEQEIVLKQKIKVEDELLSETLENAIENETPVEDEAKLGELQLKLEHEKKRLHMGRLRLAKTTRELKQMELFIDSIPTKREIQQYQKRFVELNEQINLAYSENKQLYDLYNILDSVKDCLQREVNLLNSIHDNFKEAMQNNQAKEQMIKQMEQVANTIRDLKKNGEQQMERTKADRDLKKADYNVLLEQGRLYVKMTKQLQEKWQLYEKLVAKAQELNIEIPNE